MQRLSWYDWMILAFTTLVISIFVVALSKNAHAGLVFQGGGGKVTTVGPAWGTLQLNTDGSASMVKEPVTKNVTPTPKQARKVIRQAVLVLVREALLEDEDDDEEENTGTVIWDEAPATEDTDNARIEHRLLEREKVRAMDPGIINTD